MITPTPACHYTKKAPSNLLESECFNMAGSVGAKLLKVSFAGFSYIYPTVQLFPFTIPALFVTNSVTQLSKSSSEKSLFRHHLSYSTLKMTQNDLQNNSPEFKEPTPKIPKIDQNGVSEISQNLLPLLRVKKLSEKAVLPSRASLLSAGYDLSSATEAKVPARGKALIPTDLSIGIPEGTYARIAPRSGLAWKHSIDVGAGVIDADYRGPVGVILFNYSDVDFEVRPGDRIAQLIIEKIMTPEVLEVEDLDSTVRGVGGFGSTGV